MKTLAGIPLLLLALSLAPVARGQDLPPGEGRETLQKVCTQCHDIESIPRLRYSREDWSNLVYSMKDMGADATGPELEQIVDYLAKNFGKSAAPAATAAAATKVNVNSATAKEIETGLGVTTKDSEAIVAYRIKNGNFKDIDALSKVDGVDAAKIQAAKDKIAF
ncbi:MAG: helix-hairpin-helix domain-containing protein [Acidobacteriota bacterium]